MNRYSKISSSGTTHKSRSIDFSDFFSFPQTPKPSSCRNSTTGPTTHHSACKPEETDHGNLQQVKKTETQNCSPEAERELDESGKGERFGVILGRSGSVSSASTGFQATMKRAFSLRRSSSVTERYCRIHDQYMAIASPLDGDHVMGTRTRSVKKKKKKKHSGGKILKACKRLLGL